MTRQRFWLAAAAMAGAAGAPCARGTDFFQDMWVDFGVYAEWDEVGGAIQGPERVGGAGVIEGLWYSEQGEAYAEARIEGAGSLERGPYETTWRLDAAFHVEARLGEDPPGPFTTAEAALWIDWLFMEFTIDREHRLVITHEGAWAPFGQRDELLGPGLYVVESIIPAELRITGRPGETVSDRADVSMRVRLIMTCRVDLNGDGALDFFDFLEFQNLFAAGEPGADFSGDGALDFFDFLAFQAEFAAGCP